MARLFTAKWPRLARLEALLLFVAIVRICGKSVTIRSAVDPLLATAVAYLGIPVAMTVWAACGCIVLLPFLGGMMIVDRLLTVRKGFAWLSLLSVPVWALVGVGLSGDAADLLPIRLPSDTIVDGVALFGASASILLHARSLWIGLKDRGFVGLRLVSEAEERRAWRGSKAAWYAPNPRSRNDRPPVRKGTSLLAWATIPAMLLAGCIVYYRSQTVSPQPEPAPAPPPIVLTPAGDASAARRADGHFAFNAMVNGRPVVMLLDTGASAVTIRAEEATRLGVPLGKLKFSIKVSTANGTAMMAPANIDTLTVGAITQHGVPALVASAGTLNEDLLGQSFLRNLRQVTVENNHAVLWRN